MPGSGRYLVDAHHHFQDIETYDYPWLKPDRPQALEGDLSAIRRNFLPDEYREIVSVGPCANPSTSRMDGGRMIPLGKHAGCRR